MRYEDLSTWGKQAISVQWVGDELVSIWRLTIEHRNLLVVTYFDDNGAITLGKAKTIFKTDGSALAIGATYQSTSGVAYLY